MKRSIVNEKKILYFLLIAIPAFLFFGLVVMMLWNAILPKVTQVSVITYWQSLGILVLSKILFGFGGGWRGRSHWRKNMDAKWATMTPEEREKFKNEWRSRCGRSARPVQEENQENTKSVN